MGDRWSGTNYKQCIHDYASNSNSKVARKCLRCSLVFLILDSGLVKSQCDSFVTRHNRSLRPATMDRLESLTSAIQNITLYDIKSMYNQVCRLSLLPDSYQFADDIDSSGEECRLEYQ